MMGRTKLLQNTKNTKHYTLQENESFLRTEFGHIHSINTCLNYYLPSWDGKKKQGSPQQLTRAEAKAFD